MTLAAENAIFRVEGNCAFTSPHAAGPWDPRAQHGSPPSALIAWIAETIPTLVPMRVARLAINLMRPVPLAPLTFASKIVKEGRKIQLCQISLIAEGVEVVRASVLKIRALAVDVPAQAATPPLDVPAPALCEEDSRDQSSAFVRTMSMRSAFGRFGELGRAAIWFRANMPLVAGEPLSPLLRAALAADFCNGVTPVLDFDAWTFINADLSINLAREPVGDWILLNAESSVGGEGAGLAMARLGDAAGYFGYATQSLVVEPRTSRA